MGGDLGEEMDRFEERFFSAENIEMSTVNVKVWLPEISESQKAFENLGLEQLEKAPSHQVTGAWFPDSFARAN